MTARDLSVSRSGLLAHRLATAEAYLPEPSGTDPQPARLPEHEPRSFTGHDMACGSQVVDRTLVHEDTRRQGPLSALVRPAVSLG